MARDLNRPFWPWKEGGGREGWRERGRGGEEREASKDTARGLDSWSQVCPGLTRLFLKNQLGCFAKTYGVFPETPSSYVSNMLGLGM